MEDALTARRLNRATLARQLLLRRTAMAPAEAVDHLVGMQAQVPNDPYVGLWSRLDGFAPEALGELIATRRAVRIPVMRSTIHLVGAKDALTLRPLTQPMLTRVFNGTTFARDIEGVDRDELVAAGRALLEAEPRTSARLGEALSPRWPGRDAKSLAYGVQYLTGLVQIPPRGVWERSGRPTWTTAEAWLGRPFEARPRPDPVVLRYFRAYGPASVMDVQAWCGLTRLREVVERLGKRLRPFRDEDGRELFDVPDGPRPEAGTPAPPRFLPTYDNVLLGYADRRRFHFDDRVGELFAGGQWFGGVLVDGLVRGTWKRDGGSMLIRLAGPLPARRRGPVEKEAAALLELLAPGARPGDVRLDVIE